MARPTAARTAVTVLAATALLGTAAPAVAQEAQPTPEARPPGVADGSGPVPAPAEAPAAVPAPAEAPAAVPAPADAPGPASPWPVERQGKASTNVLPLQLLLVNAGEDIAVDGVFGPETEGAVRALQERAGVTVDGIVGPQTWPLVLPPLQQGAHGAGVQALQEKLRVNGYDLAADGAFGPRTDETLRRFQRDVQIAVDGVAGRHTWRELLWHGTNE